MEFLPGYTYPTDPPAMPPGLGTRVLHLDAAENVASDLETKIVAQLAGKLDELEGTAQAIQGIIQGGIASKLDALTGVMTKLAGKIDNHLQDTLATAYSYAAPLGYQYPTIVEAFDQARFPNPDGPPPEPPPPPLPPDPQYPQGPVPLPNECSPMNPVWPPLGILGSTPIDRPDPAAGLVWQADTNDVRCYDRMIAMVWCCDRRDGTLHPLMVGFMPGPSLMVDSGGHLVIAGHGVPPLYPAAIIPGTLQVRRKNCEPPAPPGDGGGGGGGGGGGCKLTAADIKSVPTWPDRDPQPGPDGSTRSHPYLRSCVNEPPGGGNSLDIWTGDPGPLGLGPKVTIFFRDGWPWLYPDGIWVKHDATAANTNIPPDCIAGVGFYVCQGPGGGGVDQPPDGPLSCPDPGPAVCPPPKIDIPKLGQVEDDECTGFEDTIRRFAGWGDHPTGLIGMDSGVQQPANAQPPTWWQLITGRGGPAIPNMVNRFEAWARKTVIKVSESSKCDKDRLTPLAIIGGIFRFINQWTGLIPKAVSVPLQQAENFVCQYEIPSGQQADQAYLGDTITKGVWECWHKANGDMLRGADAVMQAQRARPNATLVILLYRRGVIDKQTYESLMRKEGFISELDRDRLYEVTRSWPALDDVIRMMVRDVSDKDLVSKFNMDEDFDRKVGTDLMKYADGLGVDKELLKMYWRAHWKLPSYTMLVEMYHRGRYEDTPDDMKVTLDDIRTALKQDDWLPYWIDRMVGAADRQITRVDAQRAYQLHVTEEDDLLRSFQVLGYNDKTAQTMVDIAKAKRDAQEAQRSGLPTPRTLANQFARGVVSEDDLRQQLTMLGYKEDRLERAVNSARLARSVRTRDLAAAAVQKAYLNGLLSESEASEQLGVVGIDVEANAELINLWTVQRRARGKIAPANMLCKWRGNNLIDGTQHLVGLIRVGWDKDDALRIIRSCEIDLTEKEQERRYRDQQRAIREQARQEAERRKREKEAAKAQESLAAGPEAPTAA